MIAPEPGRERVVQIAGAWWGRRVADERPNHPKVEHLKPVEARQAQMTGRVRYILAISVALVVIAFAIIWFVYA